MTPDLATLIERLEKASGPDPLLDKDIHLEVFTTITLPDCPAYTGSSDAALTLLPDGAEYEISTIYGMARVSCPLNGDVPVTVVRKDGNVILAAAECFLRARLELTKEGVQS